MYAVDFYLFLLYSISTMIEHEIDSLKDRVDYLERVNNTQSEQINALQILISLMHKKEAFLSEIDIVNMEMEYPEQIIENLTNFSKTKIVKQWRNIPHVILLDIVNNLETYIDVLYKIYKTDSIKWNKYFINFKMADKRLILNHVIDYEKTLNIPKKK